MVSKTKRVLAVILTGMMAAAALTGCQETTNTQQGSSSGSTASTASTAEGGDESAASTAEGGGDAVDVEAMTENIKTKMKEEAAANGGKIELKVWCASADLKFE